MTPEIKELVSIAARFLPIDEPVYEFGSLQVRGQEVFADLRSFFPGKKYVGADIRNGVGVDQILDLHEIDLPEKSVGTLLCMETLEHVEYPHKAIGEIYRVLKPSGIVFISTVMYCPIHSHPHDYWRFTPEALKSLLKPFANSFVGYAGKPDFPHSVIGVGFKGDSPDIHEFCIRFEEWKEPQYRQNQEKFKKNITLLTPPILLPYIAKIYNSLYGLTRRFK